MERYEQDPRSRRYTEDEKNGAYLLWRVTAGRSCREVARRLDVHEQTVAAWRDAGRWVERADKEDSEDVQSMRHAIGAVVATEVVPSLETARKLRDDPNVDARVRLDAAKWLAGLAGVAPVSKIEQAVTYQPPKEQNVVDVELRGRSSDELMRLEREYREGKRQA